MGDGYSRYSIHQHNVIVSLVSDSFINYHRNCNGFNGSNRNYISFNGNLEMVFMGNMSVAGMLSG